MRRALPAMPVLRLVVYGFAVALVVQYSAPATTTRPQARVPVAAEVQQPRTQWPAELSPDELGRIWQQAPQTTYAPLPTAGVAAPGDPHQVATPAASVVAAVISFARQQMGLPYQWGGNGPARGDPGFDCSGLTQSAYAAGGLGLPRTAHQQYYASTNLPAGAPLQPGDLVFYGSASHLHHVGLYVGRQVMIHAPTFGQNVQASTYRWSGDDYFGASRPTANLGGLGAYQPELPSRLPNNYSANQSSTGGGTGSAPRAPAAAGASAPAASGSTGSPSGPTNGSPAPGPAPAPAPTKAPLLPLPLPSLPLPQPSLPLPSLPIVGALPPVLP